MAKGQRRDHKREAFWRGVLARVAKSGLSVRAFCRHEKVSEPAFYAWRRILQERDAEGGTSPRPQRKPRPARLDFVPLVVREEPVGSANAGITVQLRGGRLLRLPATIAPERLAELVSAIESVATEGRA